MPGRDKNPKQQFAQVEELLTHWLRERRQLLGRYTEIVVSLNGTVDAPTLARRQKSLCTLLVDYASAGHFEVFHALISEAESFDDGSARLARQLLPDIGDTTEVILAYEEKYSRESGERRKLKRDLTALGEVLESRFTLEDRLIAGLHGRHRRLV